MTHVTVYVSQSVNAQAASHFFLQEVSQLNEQLHQNKQKQMDVLNEKLEAKKILQDRYVTHSRYIAELIAYYEI